MGHYLDKYIRQKALAGLGYSFPAEELEVDEAEAFVVIENHLAHLKNQSAKRMRGRHGK